MISFMYRSQFTLMICLQCGLYTGSLYIIIVWYEPHNLAQPQLEMRFSGTGEGDGGTSEGVSVSIRHWQWRPLVQVNAPGDVNENG